VRGFSRPAGRAVVAASRPFWQHSCWAAWSGVTRLGEPDDHRDVAGGCGSARLGQRHVATAPSMRRSWQPFHTGHPVLTYAKDRPPVSAQPRDEPFWRNDGLSGMSVAPDSPVPVALDQSPRSGIPGILSSYMVGPEAVKAARLTPSERRDIWLSALGARYGSKALSPKAHLETDWAVEEWTLGGMISHFACGVAAAGSGGGGQALDRVVKDVNRAGEVIGRIRALIRKAPRRKDSVDINEAVRALIELTRRNSPMVCRSSKAIAWNCNRWCSSSLSTPRKPWMRSPTRRVSCSLPPVKPSRTGCSLG
jgi:hypothetical protein